MLLLCGRWQKGAFLKDPWVSVKPLYALIPRLYGLVTSNEGTMAEVGVFQDKKLSWNLQYIRRFFEWEKKCIAFWKQDWRRWCREKRGYIVVAW